MVQPISTYFTCYPLAYLVDLVYGAGGLIICALDLDQKLPEARYMLSAILRCAAGKAFRPSDRLTDRALGRIIHALDYR